MSSIEPRLNPSQGGNGAPGAASGSNGANGGNGAHADQQRAGATTVTVAAGVESALAAVQQQLARQAATITLPPPAAPPAAAPAPRPAAPVVAPVARPAPPVAPPRPEPPVVAPAPPAVAPVVVPAPPLVSPDDTAEVATPAAPQPSQDEDDELWVETRPRRARVVVDPDELTRDERRALGKLKARKVRRIIRHVSPWSVFKVSILFYLCLWLILMVAGVILWKVGQEAGVLTNVEKFYAKASGEKVFEIDGRRVFRAASAAGVILVFAGTGFTVLLAVLFNLITDLTGGIRVTVLELESTRRVLRRGARAERVKAKALAQADGEGEDDADDDADADGHDERVGVDDAPALVEAASRPTIEFAADAIVDGRGELESSASALPARGRAPASPGDGDAAFAPER